MRRVVVVVALLLCLVGWFGFRTVQATNRAKAQQALADDARQREIADEAQRRAAEDAAEAKKVAALQAEQARQDTVFWAKKEKRESADAQQYERRSDADRASRAQSTNVSQARNPSSSFDPYAGEHPRGDSGIRVYGSGNGGRVVEGDHSFDGLDGSQHSPDSDAASLKDMPGWSSGH